MSTSSPDIPLAAALEYLDLGWQPVLVPKGSKEPTGKGWQTRTYTRAEVLTVFAGECNVGVGLGAMSPGLDKTDGGGLGDVDLDCREAIPFADAYLPQTGAVFGRLSKPRSHRLFRMVPCPKKTNRYQDVGPNDKPTGDTLIELRSTGGQSIAPPSIHPGGEQVTWEQHGKPASVDGRVLAYLVAKIAAGTLLARHWPGRGGRHDASLALAGMLLRLGMPDDEASDFVVLVAQVGGDDEHVDRRKDVATTRARLIAGEPTVGQPRLADIMGERVVAKAAAWLGQRGSHASTMPNPPTVPANVNVTTGEILGTSPSGTRVTQPPMFADPNPEDPYPVDNGRICYRQHTRDGERIVALANFDAIIIEEIVLDDGATETGELSIFGTLAGGRPLGTARVPTGQFASMGWVIEQFGVQAVVNPGSGNQDRLRAAIQIRSGDVPRRRVYGHSGWRKIDGVWGFLHSGGALTAAKWDRMQDCGTERNCFGPTTEAVINGRLPEGMAVTGIAKGTEGTEGTEIQFISPPCIDAEVRLPEPLAPIRFGQPPDTEDRRQTIRASLAMLKLAPAQVTAPLLGAAYRAAVASFAPTDVAVHIVGQSGQFKSEIAALVQAHYGAAFTRLTLPGSWSSTANALERVSFAAKDCLCVVDDFAPHGTQTQVAQLHATADRLIRSAGNHAGRERMGADGKLRPTYAPRGLIVSTGEDTPRGQSLRARLIILDVGKNAIDAARLTKCQADASSGRYSTAMAAYLSWLAPQLDELGPRLPERQAELRQQVRQAGSHPRMPDAVASLAVGWELWLRFAIDAGALTVREAVELWGRVWKALVTVGSDQADAQASEDSASRFLSLIGSAIASGRVHLLAEDGSGRPEPPGRWGWRVDRTTVIDGEVIVQYKPSGQHVGWTDGTQNVYLDMEQAYAVAQRYAQDQGETVPLTARVLWARLRELGVLASVEKERGKNYVRKTIDGVRRCVLHLHAHTLGIYLDISVPSVPSVPSAPEALSTPEETDTTTRGDAPVKAPLAAFQVGLMGSEFRSHDYEVSVPLPVISVPPSEPHSPKSGHLNGVASANGAVPSRRDEHWEPSGDDWEEIPPDTAEVRYVTANGLEFKPVLGGKRYAKWLPVCQVCGGPLDGPFKHLDYGKGSGAFCRSCNTTIWEADQAGITAQAGSTEGG